MRHSAILAECFYCTRTQFSVKKGNLPNIMQIPLFYFFFPVRLCLEEVFCDVLPVPEVFLPDVLPEPLLPGVPVVLPDDVLPEVLPVVLPDDALPEPLPVEELLLRDEDAVLLLFPYEVVLPVPVREYPPLLLVLEEACFFFLSRIRCWRRFSACLLRRKLMRMATMIRTTTARTI